MQPLNEGDIYTWTWREDVKHINDDMPYHCKSQVAVVQNELLLDTYWGVIRKLPSGKWDYTGSKPVDPNQVHLKFVANFRDLVPITRGTEIYYKIEDIVALSHPNASNAPVFKRKGAARNVSVMLAKVEYLLDENVREIDAINRKTDRLMEYLNKLADGDTDFDIW